MKVAYQGEAGAYSELAALSALPGATPLPCARFDDAFKAVEAGEANYAIIPIENSVAGRVADVHSLLPRHRLHIVAEHFEPVRHQLLVRAGTSLDDVRSIASHPMALAQVNVLIEERGLTARPYPDTAGAARALAEGRLDVDGVIASARAGEVYGLSIAAADVHDDEGNTTRFALFHREPTRPSPDMARCVTAVFFKTRNVPAALYKCLGGFATNKINMTKLESYQSERSMFPAQFYLEAEGHPEHEGLAHALEELAFFSESHRIIGVFPGHPRRYRER